MLAMARDVNTVWNFCNETQYRSLRNYCHRPQVWLSGFDLQKLTNGFVRCDGVVVGSATVQQVCEEFATRLRQFRKQRLNWRVSNRQSSRYSLGWIPFKSRALTYKNGQICFNGIKIGLWDSYGLSKYELRAGSFSEDSRGRLVRQCRGQGQGGREAEARSRRQHVGRDRPRAQDHGRV
jgi:hypothetical protein